MLQAFSSTGHDRRSWHLSLHTNDVIAHTYNLNVHVYGNLSVRTTYVLTSL